MKATLVGACVLSFLICTACFSIRPIEAKILHHKKLQPTRMVSSLPAVVTALRGGSLQAVDTIQRHLVSSPTNLFNGLFVCLGLIACIWKVGENISGGSAKADQKPAAVKSLQFRFLIVFWLLRMADWLQGPYFYEVYSSKIIGGSPVSLDLVSKLFLVGFATTGLFGPWIGRLVDLYGRKLGTLAFAVLYSLGAWSTTSALLPVLLLGRLAGGLGTSLLFSAPESWLVGEHQKGGYDGKWLGQTFGWAYAGDSLVAITAGQLASMSATQRGPTGPFMLSTLFLLAGSLIAAFKWKENVAVASPAPAPAVASPTPSQPSATPAPAPAPAPPKLTIADAWSEMTKDKKIMLVGAVQALFEGAMYIFVLQWPPAIKQVIMAQHWSGGNAVPFGKIFSCFMACCLLGSSAFGALQSLRVRVETSGTVMLAVASAAMALAALTGGTSLAALIAGFFAFEACVGMYFPSIGTLRGKYIPDSHRSVIMNLFGIPLNLIVVSVFLSIGALGVRGALSISAGALGIAAVCMAALAKIAAEAEASPATTQASVA